jgi:UDP-N-acetylmuramate dehydrogenase
MIFTKVRGEVLQNESMSNHTSFRIGGPADALAAPADRDDLVALLGEVRERNIPYAVLGGGTNLLVKDGGFRGVVISLKHLNAIEISREYRSLGGSFTVVRADAGAALAKLVSFAAEHGLTGLEFAAGIPGTVGGALCMNAGTAQGEIGDVVDSVTLLGPAGDLLVRHRDEMRFGYRTADVPAGHIVLDTSVILRHGDAGKIKAHVKHLLEQRKERQPWGLPSAGSVFRNPMDEAAGKLIESAGLKGLTIGGAQISDKHANFIVNRGNARAADVLALMDAIREKVLEMHRIRLEPEIKIIGED